MSSKKVFDYHGEQVEVHWDGRLCIHIAECGQSEGDLFVGGRDPWCEPDRVSPQQVAEICLSCPSGALTYTDKSGGVVEQAAAENTVQVSYNGPLFAKGNLSIEGTSDDMPGTRFRAALCRCGQSKNKPFCDNSHLQAGFEDYGAVGQKGNALSSVGGRVKITPAQNGPLIVSGNLTIHASSGRAAWQGEKTALCRCGASANKPFCDGSHVKINFTTE